MARVNATGQFVRRVALRDEIPAAARPVHESPLPAAPHAFGDRLTTQEASFDGQHPMPVKSFAASEAEYTPLCAARPE